MSLYDDDPITHQTEADTQRFLQTNGPAPDTFKPDVPAFVLKDATEKEKYLLEMASISAKQNGWLIKETIGLKGSHRVINTRLNEGDARFKRIDATLDVFTQLRNNYLTKQKLRMKVIIGLVSLLLLPFLSLFLEDVLKHWLKW